MLPNNSLYDEESGNNYLSLELSINVVKDHSQADLTTEKDVLHHRLLRNGFM